MIEPQEYRETFVQYLRKGTSIRFETKNAKPATHYIWRTRRDGKVRSAHAEREGQIFSWDNPPEGGHPREDYGCRCTAEPYLPEASEFMEIALQGVSGSGAAWSSRDFVNHYYRGNGRGVTVRETGHLSAIISQYMAEVETRLKYQIARRARSKRNGTFSETFCRPYDMTGVVFSIGDTVIGGTFSGNVKERHGVLTVEGSFDFYLRYEFADPADIGIEVIDLGETIFENIHRPLENYLRGRTGLPPRGPQRLGIQTGEPYSITDDWSGTLRGQIYLDPVRSAYG
nr:MULTISPECIES: phage minor head protein [unclassified Ruegeria]